MDSSVSDGKPKMTPAMIPIPCERRSAAARLLISGVVGFLISMRFLPSMDSKPTNTTLKLASAISFTRSGLFARPAALACVVNSMPLRPMPLSHGKHFESAQYRK